MPARRSILLAVLAAGCSGDAPEARDAGPARAAAPFATRLMGDPVPAAPSFQLTLSEPGVEPRRALRYRPRQGQRERAHIRVQNTTEVFIAGRRLFKQDSQATDTNFELEVGEVKGDRFLCSAWVVDARALDWERVAPGSGDDIRRSLEQLRGRKVTMTLDAHGVPVSRQLPSLDDYDADRGLATQTLKKMSASIVPLPVEPIGIGARWTVIDDVMASPIAGPIPLEYTLVAVRGDRIDVTMTARMPNEPQPMELGPEQVATYSGGELKGNLKITIDLGKLLTISIDGEQHGAVEGRIFRGAEELPFRAETIDRSTLRAE